MIKLKIILLSSALIIGSITTPKTLHAASSLSSVSQPLSDLSAAMRRVQAAQKTLNIETAQRDTLVLQALEGHMNAQSPIERGSYYYSDGVPGAVFFDVSTYSPGDFYLRFNVDTNSSTYLEFYTQKPDSDSRKNRIVELLRNNYPEFYRTACASAERRAWEERKKATDKRERQAFEVDELTTRQALYDEHMGPLLIESGKIKAAQKYETQKEAYDVVLKQGQQLSDIHLPSKMFVIAGHETRGGHSMPGRHILGIVPLEKSLYGALTPSSTTQPVFLKVGDHLGFELQNLKGATSTPLRVYDRSQYIEGRYPIGRPSMIFVKDLFNALKSGATFGQTEQDQTILQNGLSGLVIVKNALDVVRADFAKATQDQVGTEKSPEYRQLIENPNVYVKRGTGGEFIFEAMPERDGMPPVVILSHAIDHLWDMFLRSIP